MNGFEVFAKCECGHICGDHKIGRAPLGRPVVIGACRIEGCECREFDEATSVPEVPDAA